jgi:hypothetical protein
MDFTGMNWVLIAAFHARHGALLQRAAARSTAPEMLAVSWVTCARQQLSNYASHMDGRGCVGAVVYAREAETVSFGGNLWLAPWLEVGRVSSVHGDTQADLIAAANLQAELITWHACALHPELRQPGVELGIGSRWTELGKGAIVFVTHDADDDAIDADAAHRGVGFVGLALPSSTEEADPYTEFWRGEASALAAPIDSRHDVS